jgi:hypothetical protein
MENFIWVEAPELGLIVQPATTEDYEVFLPPVAIRILYEALCCDPTTAARTLKRIPASYEPFPIFHFASFANYQEPRDIVHERLRQVRDAAMVQLVEVEDEHFQNRQPGPEEDEDDFTDTGE